VFRLAGSGSFPQDLINTQESGSKIYVPLLKTATEALKTIADKDWRSSCGKRDDWFHQNQLAASGN
jgi:hypothetical protein